MPFFTKNILLRSLAASFALSSVAISNAAYAQELTSKAAEISPAVQQTIEGKVTEKAEELYKHIAVPKDDPFVMIEAAASRTFARIKNEQENIANDPEILRTIMEEELMPYIDYRFSSFKVLGKYSRKVEPIELQEFVTVFREYLITSYAVAMGYYDDQVVEFEPSKDYDSKTDVTVRAVIKDDDRPDIKVAFKVRKGRDGEWLAYDMIAEGISLLSSKQSEFESILRKEGINKVIESMRDSIRKPIVLKNAQNETSE